MKLNAFTSAIIHQNPITERNREQRGKVKSRIFHEAQLAVENSIYFYDLSANLNGAIKERTFY